MNRLQLIKSIFIISVVVVMVIGATRAFFSNVQENQHNVFTAGTLEIEMLDQLMNPVSQPLFDCQNWQPGDYAIRYININNSGSLATQASLDIVLESEQLGSQGERLGNVLFAELYEDTDLNNTYETKRFEGCLQSFTSALALGQIPPSNTKNLMLKVTFDVNGGNGYQGLTNQYKIVATGTQV